MITRLPTPIFILLLWHLCIPQLAAQESFTRFGRVTINEGLSLSSVYTIYQDSKGFMWFGTEDGLNKYDGSNITVYGSQGDEMVQLSNKWIEQIYEDRTGTIWLGSHLGLTRFNPREGVFTPFYHEPDNPYSLSNDTITAIGTDIRHQVWIGTCKGLNRVEHFSTDVERILHNSPDLKGLEGHISGIVRDQSGRLWIATHQGLFSYDQKSGLFFSEQQVLQPETCILQIQIRTSTLYILTESSLISWKPGTGEEHRRIPLPPAGADRFLVSSGGSVWLVNSEGLYRCTADMDKFQAFGPYRGGTTHSLALNPAEPLIEDSENNIWLGTYGQGLIKIHADEQRISTYKHNPANPESLSENSINCIYQDRSGTLWFGTFGAGISMLSPQANRFELYKHDPFNPNSLASSFVWTIFESSDNKLWVGTNDHGISCCNLENGSYSHYQPDERRPGSSLSHQSVRKIYQDSKGRVWAGTDGGGLNLFHPESKTFTHFNHVENDSSSISNNSVRTIYEDPLGRLWIGTRNGLNLLNEDGHSFTRYLVNSQGNSQSLTDAPSPEFIYSALYLDRDGWLWVGSYGGGLVRINPENGEYEQYYNEPDNPNSISDNIVFSLYEDSNRRLWVGTNNGLNMFYPATGSFRRFGTSEGLANEVIYGILPDEQEQLWLSTNLGIIRFNPVSFRVKNYTMNDGLQSNEFNGGAYHKGSSGKLYFGGVYGLNAIDPTLVHPNAIVPDVTLTKLEVMGKEVRVGGLDQQEFFQETPDMIMEEEEQFYTRENITYTERIELDYKYRVFSVEFAALSSYASDDFSYSYIMENLDETWHDAGNRNYVSYSNMKAGSYSFKVRAINEDGYRSLSPVQLDITIHPPYWLTWWFILFEVLVLGSLVSLMITYLLKSRTNRLLKRQNSMIRQTNAALRKSEKNLRELNATKDKLFSIISHDLKNPFSSLLSISELLNKQFDAMTEEDHRDGIKKIHNSALSLLDLVENLLTWSRAQRGKIECSPVSFNLGALVQENINLHQLMAQKKEISLQAEMDEICNVYGDRDMINTVIRNLLSNAVKFTDTGRKVRLSVQNGGPRARLLISDEGIGMDKEQVNKLFRVDQKFKSRGTAGEGGTGLGLLICKEFIEQNGGSIKVESHPGKGSSFLITLPKQAE